MGRERQPQLRLPPERCGEVVPGCGSCGQHRGQQGWQQGCLCGQQGCLRAPGGSGCSSQARKRGRERTPTAGMGQRGEPRDPVGTRLGLGQAGFGWCRIRPVSIQPSCRSLLPLPADGENPGAWDFQLHQRQHFCSRPHAAAHGLPAAKSHRRQSRRQAPSPGSCLAAMSRRSAASPRAAGTEQSRDDGLPPPA